jgi:hypothetical protein
MKLLSSLAGGLAGAITVSIIHAVLRNSKFSKTHKVGLNGNGAHSNGAHKHDNKSSKWMTIGLYIAGGLVSAAVARWLDHQDKQSIVSPLNPPVESYKPVIDITV